MLTEKSKLSTSVLKIEVRCNFRRSKTRLDLELYILCKNFHSQRSKYLSYNQTGWQHLATISHKEGGTCYK